MHSNKTIGIDLWSGQARGAGPNQRTRIANVQVGARRELGELFIGAYDKFADACREVDEPGLAIVAIDEITGQAAGLVRLRARIGRHVTAVVGRHDVCDLFLAGRDELALRHLAVIVEPVTSFAPGAPCTYRILDLRTTTGFVDERGRALRGVVCDGAAVLRCAGYAVFVLPLGDPTDWPASGADAWACVPERIYLDERAPIARGSWAVVPHAQQTHITRVPGPRDPRAALVTNGDLAGTLELQGPTRRVVLQIGEAALRDGILLGRYDRCDAGGVDDDTLSRVHALLIRIGDTLVVIDTASTCGTARVDEEPARVLELGGDTELVLGRETRLRWRWLA